MKFEKILEISKPIVPYIIIIIVVVVIRTYIVTPVIVNGESMYPTLKDKQILLLNKYDKKYKRFDIIVLKYKGEGKSEKLIKRVIGLPGEYVEYKNKKLYIDNKEVKDEKSNITDNFSLEYIDVKMKKIPDGYYLVLGDNRTNSIDSRIIGLISEKDIKGTVTRGIIPFKNVS